MRSEPRQIHFPSPSPSLSSLFPGLNSEFESPRFKTRAGEGSRVEQEQRRMRGVESGSVNSHWVVLT